MATPFEAKTGLSFQDNPVADPVESYLNKYPFLNRAKLETVMDVYDGLFQTARHRITNLPYNVVTTKEDTLYLKDKTLGDILILSSEPTDYLRINFDSVFDMPNKEIFSNIDKRYVVQKSRRAIFSRLIARPFGKSKDSPVIIARWNWKVQEIPYYIQIGIAINTPQGPEYLHKTVITELEETRIPESPQEDMTLAQKQEDEYWKLVLYAAERSRIDGLYPYACLIEPSGTFHPIIISRNKNRQQGEGIEGHAEHIALTSMNHMGFKVGESYPFKPKVYSLIMPCAGCSQMIREQGAEDRSVTEVIYLLMQPKGWRDGIQILRNKGLNEECGEPPKLSLATAKKFRVEALAILERANKDVYNRYTYGQFSETISANEI